MTGGFTMPTVFAYHDVDDTDHWLHSSKRDAFFGPLGITGIRTFVDPENPTRVGVLMDVPDMDAAMAKLRTQDGAETMAADGVRAETLVILVEHTACPSCAGAAGCSAGGATPRDQSIVRTILPSLPPAAKRS
jgi:hypothetical protein